MAWTYYQRALAMIMIITGSFNTLCVKYADQQIVPGQDGQLRHFNHPYMQSLFMFIGEMICLLVFKIIFCYYTRLRNGYEDRSNLTKGSRTFNPLVLIIPAACDVVATSINYIGLNMTYASSFQMLRGAVIVFTGILSVGFLNKKLNRREWLGITFVIFGLLLVGLSDFITMQNQKVNTNSVLTGDLLIISAQIITAVQMVVEEKYTTGQDIPALQVVGWEGVYGFIGICLIMIPLNFIYVIPPFADNSRGTLEATIDAFIQIANCDRLLMAIIGIIFSIAFFNFAGISVTKELNATTRMILDSIRTIVIWIFSLTLQWQTFHYLQWMKNKLLILQLII
ncbi:PREDICTED: solute carrier family 35 member F6 isoform X3 [Ceratosolen solmsi marchali]|uniref:Solute carrier family 35 member F6 isoform X3 n=1 Tax=Ceratosolen solmsi marchali TaxID=326594 RepID=A0AAJ7E117_9HYME|nr:PREDICTED: solute carrier family 35 member F6 isoform X3 [Ceratosolen solmsi marchali]